MENASRVDSNNSWKYLIGTVAASSWLDDVSSWCEYVIIYPIVVPENSIPFLDTNIYSKIKTGFYLAFSSFSSMLYLSYL